MMVKKAAAVVMMRTKYLTALLFKMKTTKGSSKTSRNRKKSRRLKRPRKSLSNN
jgi:hypothetical protein